jgi:hypothetical protein
VWVLLVRSEDGDTDVMVFRSPEDALNEARDMVTHFVEGCTWVSGWDDSCTEALRRGEWVDMTWPWRFQLVNRDII